MFRSNKFTPILSSRQAKLLDENASTVHNISSLVLMEQAASKTFQRLSKDFDLQNVSTAIIAGTGNNGGDGLAIARYFHFANIDFDLFLFDSDRYSEQNLAQQKILKSFNININSAKTFLTHKKKYDLIIDAVYGVGYNPKKENETFCNIAEKINSETANIVSIDVPSGLTDNVDMDNFVLPTFTYTLGGYKSCLFNINTRRKCGKIINLDLHFDNNDDNRTFFVNLQNINDFRMIYTDDFNHKYARGAVCIIGGSCGKVGSVTFAGSAAMSVGAGIVSVATNAECVDQISTINPVLVCDSIDNVDKYISHYDTYVIGPGLQLSEKMHEQLKNHFHKMKKVVLDASFFTEYSPQNLSDFDEPILTPHVGEFIKFFGVEKADIANHTIETLRQTATKYKAFVLLKSATQYLATPDGQVYVIDNPNSIAAQAGSGDILAGIIAGILSLGEIDTLDSVLCAIKIFYCRLDKLKSENKISYNTTKFIDGLREICH